MPVSILFKRMPNVYLPEISAYRTFLAKHYPHVQAHEVQPGEAFNPMDYDVVWHFMGLDTKAEGRYVVHEYNSLSTKPLPVLKNILKRFTNAKPDARVFLNEKVLEGFPFSDKVPFYLRDMGVDERFFIKPPQPKYDFVYIGSTKLRLGIMKVMDQLAGPLKDCTMLLVGNMDPAITERYKAHKNITFVGPVPYEEVPQYMAQGRYGLNFMPDEYPFNRQTATKVLEYCALGMPIVSTRYRWMENFQKKRGASFFWLDEDCANLTRANLEAFTFKTPNVDDLKWDSIIGTSGVFDFLKSK